MRISFLLLTAGLLTAASASAQAPRRHYDAQARAFYRGPLRASFGGGVALYYGDLTAGLNETFPSASVSGGVLYTWRPHWTVGSEVTWFQVGAKDQLPERSLAFRGRNLSFTTFLRFEPLRDPSWYAATRREYARVKPFLKAGVGFLVYNPKVYTGSERPKASTVFLPDERADYPATAAILPVGGGLSFNLAPRFWLTTEATYHFTTTDHLDGISQRANPERNDGYGTAEVKLEYQLK